MNSQKKAALALGAILVLGVLLVLGIRSLSSGARGGERGGAQNGKTRGTNAALADAPAPADPTPDAQDEATEGAGESRAALAGQVETKLAAGPRVAGRLLFPPGAPLDETLVVRILRTPYDDDVTAWWDPESELTPEPEFFSSSAVDGEGRFVVDLPPDASEAWIDVDGRFLYLAEPLAVSVAPAPASIELAPELGGWVTGRAVPPEGVAATELEGDRVDLRPSFSDLDWGSGFGFGRLRARRAVLDAEGRFELRGVPPGGEHIVVARPRVLAPTRREDVRSEAGLETQVELALTRGARIAGTVRDEAGAPVEGASVSVELQEEREGFEDWGRVTLEKKVETGADGAFLVQGAPVGKAQIEATREGWESSESVERELAEGEEVLGLELVVRRGRAIAGRVEWPDGRPAPGAQVFARLDSDEVRGDGEDFDWRRYMELRDKRAVADANGAFLIEGLDEGPFDVTALSAFPGAEQSAAAESAEAAATDAAGQVTLEDVVPGSEAVKLVLAATPMLHGRVLDEGERPVGAFSVQVEPVEEEEQPSFMARMEVDVPPVEFEDGTGAYRVGPLPAGKWRLAVEAEGYARTRTEPFTMPERATAGPLDVVLALGASVAGVVLAPDGSPAAGALVQSGEGAGWMRRMAEGEEESLSARTNTEGRFRLENLAAGPLALTADHEDHAPSVELPLTIEPGLRLDDVVLQLRLGGTIEGEIYGQDGKPSVGRMVNCMVPPFGSGRVSKSDDEGRFRFEQLEPGSWQVMAMPQDMGREGGDEDMDEEDFFSQMKMATVQVAEGEVVHIVLGAAPANPVRLTGRVRAGEESIAEAVISLVAEGENVLGNLRITRTDEEGAFSVELERPGTYTLQVQIESGRAHAEFVEVVPEGETHHVELAVPVGSIEGRVLGPDGEPRAQVAVRARLEGPVSAANLIGLSGEAEHTADDGTYTLRHLAPGTYTLVAGASEPFGEGGTLGTALIAGVELDEGANLRGVDFRLEEAGRVRGRVVDATGAGVSQAAIFARAASGRAVNPTTYVVSGADGSFLYSNLSPGQYTFSARGAELASLESEPVRVASGGEAEVTLTAVLGTVLVVSAVDGEKEPLPSRVSVTDEAGREMSGLVSLESLMGEFLERFSLSEHRIGPLPPGTYRVTTVAQDGRSKTRKVSLDGQGERLLKERFRE